MNLKIFPATITADGQKVPLISGWQEKATNDPVVIGQWKEFFRDRLKIWGVPTGTPNGIFALDIDVKDVNGYESIKKLGIPELPPTLFQRTPSGGMHLIFKLKPGMQHGNTVNKKLGLDTRGDGGWIAYYGMQNNVEPIEAPEWVYGLTKPKEQPKADAKAIAIHPSLAHQKFAESVAAIEAAGEGERNHTLNTHAYVVGQLVAAGALSFEFAYGTLMAAALKIGLLKDEANATIKSGLHSGLVNPLTSPLPEHPPELIGKVPAMPVIEEKTRWTPRHTTKLELQDWTKIKKPMLFEDWSTEDVHLTSAIGGVGKTTLKLFESVCLALNEPFIGFPCINPGRTLFIIGEDSEAKVRAILGSMVKQLGLDSPENEAKLDIILDSVLIKKATDLCLVTQDPKSRIFIPNKESLEKIMEAVVDIRPKQIVFDPLAMFWGPESGGNDSLMAVSKFMNELQERSNACVEMIHHIGKDSAGKRDTGQFAGRGGTALANHSRVVRTLIRLGDDEYKELTHEELLPNQYAIQCTISKFTDGSAMFNKPFIILREGYIFIRKQTLAQDEKEDLNIQLHKNRIFKFIKENDTEQKPITQKYLEAYFATHHDSMKKATVSQALTMLAFDGLIETVDHPNLAMKEKWIRVKR
jgi:RecA-family ATPase